MNSNGEPDTAKTRLEAYRRTYLDVVKPDNFDRELWQSVVILDGKIDGEGLHGVATYGLTLPARYANFTGNIQGGAIATVLDGLTNCSIALVASHSFWSKSGVTMSLEIKFLQPVKHSERLIVECEIVSIDIKTAIIQGRMKRAENNELLAVAMQHMVAIRSKL